MRNPIHGKIKLDVRTLLMPSRIQMDAMVYLHLKGYARARVSHLDIEKMGLGKVIRRGRGNFLQIKGVKYGFEIELRESRELDVDGKKVAASKIRLINHFLNEIVGQNELKRAWIGRKYDGIYVGFRKEEVEKLEKIALKKFGIKTLKKLEKPPSIVKR